ncbi:MAG: carboxylesterase/lipase family protein [Lachnospiraceae bacterium]|nr:carboxylesterase/lipase family protein [Lachnospiraceae bacterium]
MNHQFIYNQKTAVVDTKQGKIRGYYWDRLYVFKGIPYAMAKRFHAPQPVEPWDGVLEADSFGYVCPLPEMPKPRNELRVPHRYWIMDENCQNLNLWTPGLDDKKRPVLVWLHGGGFEAGSAIEHIAYEGENMSREGDVVVITINHRLNVLGYFDLSEFGEEYANSANAGTDDIVASLKWIHENIEAFGGDPQNVTVFGQSGGGAKVTALLQTPAADGLFAKGINMSGVIGPILADRAGSGREFALAMMKELGVETVKEMETVPYPELAAAYMKLKHEFADHGKYAAGMPRANDFYAGMPETNGFRKETAHVPLMVGTVYGEFTSFAQSPYRKPQMTAEEGEKIVRDVLGADAEEILALFKEAYPRRNPVDLLMIDFIFRLPTQQYVRQRSALNDCTYSYLFNLDMPIEGGSTPWHCADIPFFFHNTDLVPYANEPLVSKIVEKQIFDSVMAFARTGNPNTYAVPEWKACTPDEEYVMIFDRLTEVRCNFDEKLVPMAAKVVGPAMKKEAEKNREKIQH